MNEKVQKNLLCIVLAVIFTFNTIYNSGMTAYAAGESVAEGVVQGLENSPGEAGQGGAYSAAGNEAGQEKPTEPGVSDSSQDKAVEEISGGGSQGGNDSGAADNSSHPGGSEKNEELTGNGATAEAPGTEEGTGDKAETGNPAKNGETGKPEESEKDNKPGETEKPEETENKGDAGKPGETGEPEETGKQGETGEPEETGKPGEAGKLEENGNPEEAGKLEENENPEETEKTGDTENSENIGKPGESGQPEEPGKSADDSLGNSGIDNPVEDGIASEGDHAKVYPEHSLAEVFWNPIGGDETGGAGLSPGSDDNSGASQEEPVQSIETALFRASEGAVIYCMNEYEVTSACVIDGTSLGVTLKAWNNSGRGLFQVTKGFLLLENLNMEGNRGEPAITLKKDGELIFGKGVSLGAETEILAEQPGKPVRLSQRPKEGFQARIVLGEDWLDGLAKQDEAGGICLADGKKAGVSPEKYVTFTQLPEGYEVKAKSLQIWLKKSGEDSEIAMLSMERDAARDAIYLSGTGDDGNDGLTTDTAVKTFQAAQERLKQEYAGGTECDLVISGSVEIGGTETWEFTEADFPWHPEVLRHENYDGFLLIVNGDLTLRNITIDGNRNGRASSKAIIDLGGVLRMEQDSLLIGNTVYTSELNMGGGIYVHGFMSKLIMNGGSISGNYATNGGGVYAFDSATIEMNSGGIKANNAKDGGGIWTDGSGIEVLLNGGSISDNQVDGNGGGIYMQATFPGPDNLLLNGTEISDNGAADSAGGIYLNGASFRMQNGSIERNTASQGGGIFSNASATMKIEGGNISQNTASLNGGGIAFNNEGVLEINGGVISENTATAGGGLIFYDGFLQLSGGVISDNQADVGGGVCFWGGDHTSFVMSGGEIIENTSDTDGGGVAFSFIKNTETVVFSMTGGKISRNTAGDRGGGVMVSMNTAAMVIDGEISGNTAGSAGGGIYCGWEHAADQMRLRLMGTISGNSVTGADGKGGGIYMYHTNFEMEGGEVTGNSAQLGGGIARFPDRGTVSLYGGKIYDNQAVHGVGMYVEGENSYSSTSMKLAVKGGCIEQGIAVNDLTATKIRPIELLEPIETEEPIGLELVGRSASINSKIVIPDGIHVTDAGAYMSDFYLINGGRFSLSKKDSDIVLVQAYFVDGVHGNDDNSGETPGDAFKTVEAALNVLGGDPGTVFVCNTVTVKEDRLWESKEGQTITRYNGGTVDGTEYPGFDGTMVKITESGKLTMDGVTISGNAASSSGYLLEQGGRLLVSSDCTLDGGNVFLQNGRFVEITGIRRDREIMRIEKENPKSGDVIGSYDGNLKVGEGNITLAPSMVSYRLVREDAKMILAGGPDAYVDGQNGDDSNSGDRPDVPFKTLARAYDALQSGGGRIHILDTVEIYKDTTLSAAEYVDENGTTSLGEGSVSILREPGNQTELFQVDSGRFTLSGIAVDGGGVQAAGVHKSLVEVGERATLILKDGAALTNNHMDGDGGAIRSEGTVELYDCRISGNQAQRGQGIYHAGELYLYSGAVVERDTIYLEAQHYIQVQEGLSEGACYILDLHTGDAVIGRTIAAFAEGSFEAGKVINEAEHFSILPTATVRGLAVKGADTLVLSEGFGVNLKQKQIFGRMGDIMSVQALIAEAQGEVKVEAKLGGNTIPAEVAVIPSGVEIQIPIEPEHIGEVSLIFTSQRETVVDRVTVSGYTLTYGAGKTGLEACAQSDTLRGTHRDSARIRVYNGADVPQVFSVGGAAAAYEDGNKITLDSSKVYADMPAEQAMTCFGLEIEGETAVAAGGVLENDVILLNGDLITEERKGSIILKDVKLGDTTTEIPLTFITRPVTRVQVMARKDGSLYSGCRLALMDAAGNMTELAEANAVGRSALMSASQRELWPYRVTGLAPGSYRLYANGIDTGRDITVEAGTVKSESLDFYTLQLELNGGSLAQLSDSYLQGVEFKLPVPEREGYRFEGWYTSEDYSQGAVTAILPSAEGAYRLYAKWVQDLSSGSSHEPEEGKPGGNKPGTQDPDENSQGLLSGGNLNPGAGETQSTPVSSTGRSYASGGSSGKAKTGDQTVIITDIALIGGMAYLMKMFLKQSEGAGMSEEQKDMYMYNIIRKARGRNYLLRLGALFAIGIVLAYYYTLGMKEEAKELLSCKRNYAG